MSYKRRNIIQALREYGFEVLREGRRHTIYSRGGITVPVPRHRQITPATSRSIARIIGVNWQEFESKIS